MSIYDKFMERVFVLTYDKGCWLWTGSLNAAGRPVMKWQGKSIIAARVSLMLSTGRLPKDLCALHTCHNAVCVRPDHLYWDTRTRNGKDMSESGRVVYDKGIIGRKGELAYNHRFTESDVIEMRRLHWEQGESLCSIGRQFHINSGGVHRIVHGQRWSHVKAGLPKPEQANPTTTTRTEILQCIAMLSMLRASLLRLAA